MISTETNAVIGAPIATGDGPLAIAIALPHCYGDCDNSGSVTITEILTLVNIVLGDAEPSACGYGVPTGSEVNIARIIQAVNNALHGCGGAEE